MIKLNSLAWVLSMLAVLACGRDFEHTPELEESLARISAEISGERLLRNLERYVAFGHRYYGAAQRDEAIAMMISDLAPFAATVERQSFSAHEPLSDITWPLTNVIARTAPEASRRLLLATHWDTRLWADEDPDPARRNQPIPGANDGTSGLVVLMELLRVLDKAKALDDLGVDVVLFDGEELGRPGSDAYCKGSSYFAGELRRYYPDRLPIAAVVVDMIGDRELTLKREAISMASAPGLSDLIWTLGRRRFPEVFADTLQGPVFDDHVPLQRRGIPSALLIDLDYEPWHTLGDTPEQCSAESLELITRHLAEVVLVLASTWGASQ